MDSKPKNRVAILQLCGLPAVGKTHFTRQYERYLDAKCRELVFVTLTYDEIMHKSLEIDILRLNLWRHYRTFIQGLTELLIEFIQNGDFDLSFHSFLANHANFREPHNTGLDSEIVGNFLKLIDRCPHFKSNRYFVICLDDNAYYESMRWKTVQLAVKLNCSYICLCFRNESLSALLESNASRPIDSQVNPAIIESMFEKFEYPTSKFELEFSMITTSNVDDVFYNDLTTKLMTIVADFNLAHIVLDKAKYDIESARSKQASLTNVAHQTDLILRKMISKRMASACGDKTNLASKLKERKDEILRGLVDNTDINEMFRENLYAYEKHLHWLLFDVQ
jgi:tRNA uridine 5-carbamoylmethylation protein Kti12